MSTQLSLRRRLLAGWLTIAARFGEVQTLLLLGLVYAFVIGPVAIVVAVARRDLLDKRSLGRSGSAWRSADTRPAALENVKQPF